MTPEQTLIQQITRMIENGLLERNALLEDCADQYAELCASVNARLLQCANYLEKGLLSEAMYIARQSPDLLEAVALVQFPLAKKWENICVDLELTMPPLLHAEIVEKLKKASEREQALRPLLQEFRKYTYQREHRPALEVLRKIRCCDPDNQSWAENLRLLEEEELPVWLERLEKALQTNNLPELKLIEAELRHPQRVAPVPEIYLKKLSQSLLQEHAEELLKEASDLMEEMHLHLGASSEPGVRRLLEQAELMEKNEAFLNRPENWDRMKSEAGAFLASAGQRKKAEQQHQDEVKDFQKMLEAGRASDLELRQTLQRLDKPGLPVPDLLKNQMEELIAERRRLRLLKLKSSFGILLVVLLVVLGAGGSWFYIGHRSRICQKRLLQISTLIQQKDYRQAEGFLKNFKSDYPDRLQDEDVVRLVSELEQGLKKEAENRRQKEVLMAEMQQARKDGFNISDAQAASWMSRAALLEWTAEEKLAVDSWQSAWLREKKDRLESSNALVREAVRKCETWQSYHRDDDPDEELLKQIGDLQEELRLVRSRALHVEEGLRLTLDQRVDGLEAWKNDLQKKMLADSEKRKRLQEKQKAMAGIESRLASSVQPENLGPYFSSLARLVQLGGPDMKALYGRILDQKDQQNSAFLLNHFQSLQLPLNLRDAQAFQKILQSSSAETVWTREMQMLLEEYRRQREIVKEMPGILLEQEEQYLLFRLEYRRKGTEEWHLLYMPEILKHREETVRTVVRKVSGRVEEKSSYTLYWGQVYYWEGEDGRPVLVHSSRVFPEGLNTRDYDIRHFSPRKEEQLCPHGRFLIQMVADSAGVKDPGIFLLKKLQEIDRLEDVEIVPRFWLKKRIVNFLSERVYPRYQPLQDLARQYARWDFRVPWMNRKHPQTAELEKELRKAGKMLPDIEGFVTAVSLHNRILACSLGAAPRCIGVLLPGKDGGLRLAAAEPAGKRELRVLRIASVAGARPVWLKLAENGGAMIPSVLRQCAPGQPVFAVRESSRKWLLKNVSVSEEDWRKLYTRPSCWPENAWEYPERQVQ